MDIRIDDVQGSFKLRVVGIVRRNDGKILLQNVEGNTFYCLPGGHAEIGESLTQAVQRELEEELQFNVNVEKLGFLAENFFYSNRTKTNMHEEGFYFYLKSPKQFSENEWVVHEVDKGVRKELMYKWTSVDELDTLDIRPAFLKDILKNMPTDFEHYVIRNDKRIN